MFLGPDPLRSLRLINDFGFFSLVFAPPCETVLDQQELNQALILARAVQWILDRESLLLPLNHSPLSKEEKKYLFMACCIYPYRSLKYQDEKGKVLPMSKHVIMTSLKVIFRWADFFS
jgi:hypothetical protein